MNLDQWPLVNSHSICRPFEAVLSIAHTHTHLFSSFICMYLQYLSRSRVTHTHTHIYIERERERERERQTERETDRERDRQRERYYAFRVMSVWWPSIELPSWCPMFKLSLCNSFEDRVSLHFIYRYLIFKWVAENCQTIWQGSRLAMNAWRHIPFHHQ